MKACFEFDHQTVLSSPAPLPCKTPFPEKAWRASGLDMAIPVQLSFNVLIQATSCFQYLQYNYLKIVLEKIARKTYCGA